MVMINLADHPVGGGVPPGQPLVQQPPPKSSYPSLPLNDPANLRRELDNRYFHERNLAAGTLRPPGQPFMGSDQISNPLASSLVPPLQRPPGSQSSLFLGPLVSFLSYVLNTKQNSAGA